MTTGVPVVDLIIAIALGITALITTLGLLRRKVLKPVSALERALPVLIAISEEFRPNDGHSLKDIITQIRDDGAVLSDYAHSAKHDTINRLAVLQGDQVLLGERVEAFMVETKERFEVLGAEVTTMKTDVAVVMTIIDRRKESRTKENE